MDVFADQFRRPGQTRAGRAGGLAGHVVTRCRALGEDLTDASALEWVSGVCRSLDEQLRIAVIGPAGRGRTTLVNALVGRHVLGEGTTTACVTQVCGGFPERIRVQARDGTVHAVAADREDAALQRQLRDLSATCPDPLRLRVELAQQALADCSFLDVPPLGAPPLGAPVPATASPGTVAAGGWLGDAQAYLLVLSPRDLGTGALDGAPVPVAFGGGRRDGAGALSAATCVTVLGQADTIAGGPAAQPALDPLRPARELLYRWVEALGERATESVVLATTWARAARCGMLGEPELTVLRHLVSARGRTELTSSADCFRHAPSSVSPQHRAQLLAQLGIDGVRVALALVDLGCDDVPTLCRELERVSGFNDLGHRVAGLVGRGDLLQADWALSRLGSYPRTWPDAQTVHDVAEELRLDPALHRLDGLAALHLLAQGVPLPADLAQEVRRLALADTPAQCLGLPDGVTTEEMVAAAAQGAARWQVLALSRPRAHQEQERLARMMARLYTHLRRRLMGSYL